MDRHRYTCRIFILLLFFTLIPEKEIKEPETIDVEHKEITPKTRDRIIK
jgi:hypothetical protein